MIISRAASGIPDHPPMKKRKALEQLEGGSAGKVPRAQTTESPSKVVLSSGGQVAVAIFSRLSTDVATYITRFLDCGSIVQLNLTSKGMRTLAENSWFYKGICRESGIKRQKKDPRTYAQLLRLPFVASNLATKIAWAETVFTVFNRLAMQVMRQNELLRAKESPSLRFKVVDLYQEMKPFMLEVRRVVSEVSGCEEEEGERRPTIFVRCNLLACALGYQQAKVLPRVSEGTYKKIYNSCEKVTSHESSTAAQKAQAYYYQAAMRDDDLIDENLQPSTGLFQKFTSAMTDTTDRVIAIDAQFRRAILRCQEGCTEITDDQAFDDLTIVRKQHPKLSVRNDAAFNQAFLRMEGLVTSDKMSYPRVFKIFEKSLEDSSTRPKVIHEIKANMVMLRSLKLVSSEYLCDQDAFELAVEIWTKDELNEPFQTKAWLALSYLGFDRRVDIAKLSDFRTFDFLYDLSKNYQLTYGERLSAKWRCAVMHIQKRVEAERLTWVEVYDYLYEVATHEQVVGRLDALEARFWLAHCLVSRPKRNPRRVDDDTVGLWLQEYVAEKSSNPENVATAKAHIQQLAKEGRIYSDE